MRATSVVDEKYQTDWSCPTISPFVDEDIMVQLSVMSYGRRGYKMPNSVVYSFFFVNLLPTKQKLTISHIIR